MPEPNERDREMAWSVQKTVGWALRMKQVDAIADLVARARAEGAAEAAQQLAAKDLRIAELEAENARHKACARLAELESDNTRLKSLSRFTQHKWDCRLNMSATESCTCGFHAALAQKGGE